MSKVISTEDIQDGMVLAEPLINNFGQTLLPAGITLGTKHVKTLKTWNIFTVSVKGDDNDEETEISEEMKGIAEEIFSKRISWKPKNLLESDLYMLGIIFNARKHFGKKREM
ncbi:MAG: hypothetical protein HW421_344 [Ignavibacteria bacterium]|nr:hypothetical protein [Ignavibacteria bacterium]